MKYKICNNLGDSIPVPQIVFQKLNSSGSKDDARFRVALFMLSKGECDDAEISRELGISPAKVKSAIDFWEGAGLVSAVVLQNAPEIQPYNRKRLTTGEVVNISREDKTPAFLIAEVQRLFGGIVSQSDINVFMTLYSVDKIPAEVILMAASFCAERGKTSARYIEKMLLSWQKEGITGHEAVDGHLKLLAEREKREEEVAKIMEVPVAAMSLAERRKINAWAEDFGFGTEMLEAARLAAGEHMNEIRYVDKILSRWAAKGYTTPRDVQMSENVSNIRVQGSAAKNDGADLLGDNMDYVPMRHRRQPQNE